MIILVNLKDSAINPDMKQRTTPLSMTLAKSVLVIIFVSGFCLSSTAQTNIVKPKPIPPPVVSILTMHSNRIAVLEAAQSKKHKEYNEAIGLLQLQLAAGKITQYQLNEKETKLDNDRRSNMKVLSKELAERRLKIYEIKKAYKIPEK